MARKLDWLEDVGQTDLLVDVGWVQKAVGWKPWLPAQRERHTERETETETERERERFRRKSCVRSKTQHYSITELLGFS